MVLRGDVMDFPYTPDGAQWRCSPRHPLAAWLLVAMIGVILGGAALAAGLATDTRDFATRHGSVLATRAL
jgi:hypothetical protein